MNELRRKDGPCAWFEKIGRKKVIILCSINLAESLIWSIKHKINQTLIRFLRIFFQLNFCFIQKEEKILMFE